MTDYYTRVDGVVRRATLAEWANWFEAGGNRVKVTELPGGVTVSTVFLGTPHVGGMFETMAFGGPFDQEQARSETEAAAMADHAGMVARCQAGSN